MMEKVRGYRIKLIYTKLILIFFSALIINLFTYEGFCSERNKNVLFISSYNENYEFVPFQIDGIKAVLKENKINLDVEFMDSKRFSSDEYIRIFQNIIKYKINNLSKYDAIIVGDDNALQFSIDYQNELFKGLPIIFLGINDFHRAEHANKYNNMTGILESSSLKGTIEAAKNINKNAKKIVAVLDNSLTGIGYREQFYSLEKDFDDLIFDELNVSNYTFNEFVKILEGIGDDSILLYISMYVDINGENITTDDAVVMLREHTRVPVYCISSVGIGEGLFGGKMADYFEVGKMAASMAVDIINGTPISNIAMVYESPSKYYFDYNIIKKYNIDEEVLPPNATYINKEENIYVKYKVIISITLMFIVFLIILSTFSTLDSISRRKIERALKESHKKLEEIAESDYLTKLPNRLKFMNTLKEEISKGKSGAVILIDIDNFKSINDTLGHGYGDNIIIELAEKFSCIKDSNFFVSRFGGDEFLILITNVKNIDDIKCFLDRIKEIFDENLIIDGIQNYIKCTMGISRFPIDSTNADELISYADTAMYSAKHLGKNNYMYYNDIMKQDLKSRLDIEAILRESLYNDGYKLLYQPNISVGTGEVTGFEALLRLKNYDVSPSVFIPIAEETGLILEIGRWVTQEVIKQISEWNEKSFKPKIVSLNFSSKQLKDTGYFDFLNRILIENNVNPNYLEIEFTESILLEKTESFLDFLDKLKRMGVKMSLDDFGTGFSSLHYLTYMPVNKVKLDKSLCRKFLESDNISVIENIISIAHSLNLTITAEGIETIEQYYNLKLVDCDYIQGYLFSKPLEVSEIEKIYDKNLLDRINNPNS